MPYVLEMTFSAEQAAALRLADIHEGKVEWWYLKRPEALAFVTRWLPRYGRVPVRLTIVGERGQADQVEEIPVGLPDPVGEKDPVEYAKPIAPGVLECRLYRTTKKAPFLPIVCLHDRETRRVVTRYLEGCSFSEVKRWLEGVGELEFDEDVSWNGEKCHKFRFISRSGYDTVVDIFHSLGIHIVY